MRTVGSLCSGYGGLDLAVEHVFDARTVWHVENDPAPSRVLTARWPNVPNYGDLTTLDWATLEPVDILTAGYPCQPFSQAGQRKGTDDARHLWPYIAEAVRRIRPGWVVLENVAGHRSMGFGDVLGDLAALGYDTRWASVRASDVGAPHRRERLFVVASVNTGYGTGSAEHGKQPPFASFWTREPSPGATSDTGGETVRLGPGLRPGDTARVGWRRLDDDAAPDAADTGCLGQRPRAEECGTFGVEEASDDTERGGRERRGQAGLGWSPDAAAGGGPATATPVAWGAYEPAVRRWERALGRNAPNPTEPGPRGGRRLSPRFVEWMMGLPDGWVTDIPGLSRNDRLKILGNGVVPPQATAALQWLTG